MDVAMYISPETTTHKTPQRPPVIVQGTTNDTQALLSLSRWMRAVCRAQAETPDYKALLCRETSFLLRTGAIGKASELPEAYRNALEVLEQMGR